MKNQVVGVFGGTFDPIHNGHVLLAKTAHEELKLDKVILIPAYIPPHKRNTNITDEFHRVNMAEIAVADYDFIEISELEIKLQGASYTARTLSILKEEYNKLVFILGADSYVSLENWYHPEVIFAKAEIACAYRDGIERDSLLEKAKYYQEKYGAISHILHMPSIDISSTAIRNKIKNNEPTSQLISENVLKYIKENNLYNEL